MSARTVLKFSGVIRLTDVISRPERSGKRRKYASAQSSATSASAMMANTPSAVGPRQPARASVPDRLGDALAPTGHVAVRAPRGDGGVERVDERDAVLDPL